MRRDEISRKIVDQPLIPDSVPLFDEAGRLLLPLRTQDFLAYADPFECQGRLFLPKTEYHITLIGTALAEVTNGSPAAREAIGRVIERRARAGDWRYRLHCDFLLVGKEPPSEDMSIVVMAAVDIADQLYSALEDSLRVRVERPPLHVTLFTHGSERGVAIPTAASLKRRKREYLQRLPSLREDAGGPLDEETGCPITCPWCKSSLNCPHLIAELDLSFCECRRGVAVDCFDAIYRKAQREASACRGRVAGSKKLDDPDETFEYIVRILENAGAICITGSDDSTTPGFTSVYSVAFSYEPRRCLARVLEI